jgi:cell division transport system permease protein
MGVSAGYVARETAANLWRNRMMAVAAVLTVAVSLSLVGAALLLRQAVSRQLVEWGDNVNLELFLRADVSTADLANLRTMIAATPQISHCTYLDKAASHALMARILNDPIAVAAVPVADTPPLFRCTLVHPGDAPAVAAVFSEGVPGVWHALYPAQGVRDLEAVSGVLQLVLFVIAVVLLLSSLVLILNAIRMAIFSRRREVGVMKLVGATNWFIRLPFMLEGLVQGLLGALLAVGIVALGDALLRYAVLHLHLRAFTAAIVPGGDVLVTELVVVALGVVVGTLSSAVAVRRFLEV